MIAVIRTLNLTSYSAPSSRRPPAGRHLSRTRAAERDRSARVRHGSLTTAFAVESSAPLTSPRPDPRPDRPALAVNVMARPPRDQQRGGRAARARRTDGQQSARPSTYRQREQQRDLRIAPPRATARGTRSAGTTRPPQKAGRCGRHTTSTDRRGVRSSGATSSATAPGSYTVGSGTRRHSHTSSPIAAALGRATPRTPADSRPRATPAPQPAAAEHRSVWSSAWCAERRAAPGAGRRVRQRRVLRRCRTALPTFGPYSTNAAPAPRSSRSARSAPSARTRRWSASSTTVRVTA